MPRGTPAAGLEIPSPHPASGSAVAAGPPLPGPPSVGCSATLSPTQLRSCAGSLTASCVAPGAMRRGSAAAAHCRKAPAAASPQDCLREACRRGFRAILVCIHDSTSCCSPHRRTPTPVDGLHRGEAGAGKVTTSGTSAGSPPSTPLLPPSLPSPPLPPLPWLSAPSARGRPRLSNVRGALRTRRIASARSVHSTVRLDLHLRIRHR